jgi:hypothetical protein
VSYDLKSYRAERQSFILGLKMYFGIDFYKLDKRERSEWLRIYIENKKEILMNMYEYWEDNPPSGRHIQEVIKYNYYKNRKYDKLPTRSLSR